MRLTNIARGWYHFIKATSAVKTLMEERLAICDECPEKEQLSPASQKLMTAINAQTSLYRCGHCHCPLSAKTSDPKEKCPLKKW